uniref:Reverse transcriptase domain-containing protein n=1 Tax=Tanacetum cinerariifolium TaxID=118510 RepID=A0A6L2J6H4_TANCI|nr:reverse transcriptase domain-containing protein [Tanacetum cinerariifolium]
MGTVVCFWALTSISLSLYKHDKLLTLGDTSSTQGKASSISTVLSWGVNISPKGFLPSIVLLVVLIVAVVIVVMVVLVVVVGEGNPSLKTSISFLEFSTIVGHKIVNSWNLLIKKSRGSNISDSDNTRDEGKTVSGAIGACGGGIGLEVYEGVGARLTKEVTRVLLGVQGGNGGMPNYGKFLQELVSNKHKLKQISFAFLSDESSALIQNKVPPKLRDPGSFLIPYFVILEMEKASKVPLILGRSFLYIADAVIRVKQKQLNLRVGTERMTFHMDSAMKHSYSNDDTCFNIDVIDEILEEDFDVLFDEGSKILHSIKGTILKEKLFAEFDEFMAMIAEENSESESDTEEPPFEKITFNIDYKIKTSLEEPPTDLELKPLPDNLEYAFLEEPSFLPIIISSQLLEQDKIKLISVLKRHSKPLFRNNGHSWNLSVLLCTFQEVKALDAILEDNVKKSCMISFRQLHSHLRNLSQNDLQGSRTESGFIRAFVTIFDQDLETFTGTMFFNVEQLEKQLDKEDIQELGSMAPFNVLET